MFQNEPFSGKKAQMTFQFSYLRHDTDCDIVSTRQLRLWSISKISTRRRPAMAGPVQGSYLLSETAAERNIFYIFSIIWN